MIKAIRLMKHPARKGRNPEPGSRNVPNPSRVDPYILISPTANQKRLPTRSACI
jgi:hypothetical protein